MKYFILILMLVCLPIMFRFGTSAFAAQTTGLGWDPLHTKVFVVGVLKYKSKDFDSFSIQNRRDRELVKQFMDLGVPKDKIVFLPNEKAKLQAIKTSLATSLKSCQPNDTFIFYYCGHGWLNDNYRGYFANYDAGDADESCLAIDDIVKIFKTNFHGAKALFLGDCCRSGALADALLESKCGLEFGALAAATSGEDSTGNWTFTQAVIDCFAGHNYADFNKDGVITFAELGTYVKDEMKLMEGQVASVVSGNGFDNQMKIANVVFRQEAIPERVEVRFEGDWWKAKLLERRGNRGLVQWFEIGWDAPEDDTWVPLKTVRALKGGTARGVDYVKDAASQSGGVNNLKVASSSFSINQKILVLSDGKYYPAVIQKVDGQRYFVHYADYDSSSDEWVGTDRMKRRKNATPRVTYAINQKVSVLSDGDYYPAIVRKVDGKRYFVHYDDYDKSNDEWVGFDRVKKR